jgi:hypothetical protein
MIACMAHRCIAGSSIKPPPKGKGAQYVFVGAPCQGFRKYVRLIGPLCAAIPSAIATSAWVGFTWKSAMLTHFCTVCCR